MNAAPDAAPRRSSRGALFAVVIIVAAAAVSAAFGISSRQKALSDLTKETHDMAVVTVAVTRPAKSAASEAITLPGNIQAFTDAAIFARTSGYLKARHADIGSRVKAGQMLAEIDTPEIDQQLQQARADLTTAEANAHLAQTTSDRYQDLIKTDSVSRQDMDMAVGGAEARRAEVASSRANVKRLEQMQGFNRIYAPFDGVVTARNTDIGALIDSGNGAKELFHIAATNRLRTIVVNLERHRWLPRPLPADRVVVNIAAERLVLYSADRPVFSTRVVVGQDDERNQSPEFRATIDASFFNPPWVIPADIAKAEILPKLVHDAGYLTRNRMVLLAGGEVEQLPGPEAGLGLIMFDMPNRFDVYLHDTPDRYIFNRDNRRISHGCIRVQNPLQFAALLMRQPIDSINQGIARGLVTGNTTRNNLPVPVPVFVVYQTAVGDTDGTVQLYPDFYNRDTEIWRKLQKWTPPRAPAMKADNRPPSPKLSSSLASPPRLQLD